jgi:hypothetical protein
LEGGHLWQLVWVHVEGVELLENIWVRQDGIVGVRPVTVALEDDGEDDAHDCADAEEDTHRYEYHLLVLLEEALLGIAVLLGYFYY